MRHRFRVRGTVQGVGFRPFVFATATRLGLRGFVQNESGGVVIEAEGPGPALQDLRRLLQDAPPPRSVVEEVEVDELPPAGLGPFEIRESVSRVGIPVRVSPDLGPCPACLSEMSGPADRRFGYPFINCTDCGPRYSIVRDIPYDRAKTSMSAFTMCAECEGEFRDPASRRFHAEPNACARCGPELSMEPGPAEDRLREAIKALKQGLTVAIKGTSGFHLACDARNQDAVARLRAAKGRPHKPFAVMFRNLGALEAEVETSDSIRDVLIGPRRPIVLLPRRHKTTLAEGVAPHLLDLGAFLPTTPLHQLILDGVDGPLVMTSGNLSEEPIAAANDEAWERLAGVAHVFLFHDRDIHARQDDSVVQIVLGKDRVIRRARGFVPEPIDLGFAGPDVLGAGADLKNTICLASGGAATLGPHIGDLESLQSQEFFGETRRHLEQLLRIEPRFVAHDLHPGYHSTRLALATGLEPVAVQHHHAHIASCLIDNGRRHRVIGVAWDGTGYGPDSTMWGGEFLIADLGNFERAGFLRPVLMAGGDAAARQPWRMALACLLEAGLSPYRVAHPARDAVRNMIEKRIHTVPTSSAGRLFDAVSSLLEIRHEMTYEGQAAAELEALARGSNGAPEPTRPYEVPIDCGAEGSYPLVVDSRALIRAVVRDVEAGIDRAAIGLDVHRALARVIGAVSARIRERTKLDCVALSGGCFQNPLLTSLAHAELTGLGFEVLLHRRVPPNDGGISLGQAAVAAWRKK